MAKSKWSYQNWLAVNRAADRFMADPNTGWDPHKRSQLCYIIKALGESEFYNAWQKLEPSFAATNPGGWYHDRFEELINQKSKKGNK